MKVLIVGMGVQGRKRLAIAAEEVAATVDPVLDADFRAVADVPLERYDAALVCTPDQAKPDLLSYLLGHGKHVLVEKPLLAPPSEIREFGRLAETNGVACYTAYNHRFEPHIARLKTGRDAGALGQIYQARLFYGNGTARLVRDSAWRDQGMGVLSDLGSHLLDMVYFLFGDDEHAFRPRATHCFENQAFDHVVLGSEGRPALQLEMTLLSWRNTFTVDVLAERGTAHIHGLCKWGPSTFTLRHRILPSGRPREESWVLECPDPTWTVEYEHFRLLCRSGGTNLANDMAIHAVLDETYRAALKGAGS